MAYLRGDYYFWCDDGDYLHLWATDGEDEHLSGWENTEKPGGVKIPEKVMDEYVLMRVAELIYDGKIEETLERIFGPDGQGDNFGAMVLKKNAQKLKQAFSKIQMDEPEEL